MSYHAFSFAFITIINLIFYIFAYRKVYHPKPISTFFHLYFCILATFVYKDNDLIYCSTIYFISDSCLQIYFNSFKTFNKFHHLFVLFLIYNHEHLDKTIINYSGIHEFSTIILCLIDMQLISKNTFENIFPISFILCRIVIFNILVLSHLQKISFILDTFNYSILSLLNLMNLGIVIKMNLVQKSYYTILRNYKFIKSS